MAVITEEGVSIVPAHKLTRKDLKRDKFVETTSKVVDFLQDHYIKLAVGVVAIVVIAFLVSAYFRGQAGSRQQASYLLYQGQSLLTRGAYDEARIRLQECIDQYGSSSFGKHARIDLAHVLSAQGDHEGALAELRDAEASISKDDPLHETLMQNTAAALSDLGRYGEAEAIYRDLLAVSPSPQQRLGLTMRLSECLQADGRMAEALSVLEELHGAYLRGEVHFDSRDLEIRLGVLQALAKQ